MDPALLVPDAAGVPPAEWHAAAQLLYREAELLDAGRLTDWLALIAPEIDYRILNRTQRIRPEREAMHTPDSFVVACDRAALEARIVRLSSEFAWSEETPAATRRFITNVRVERDGDVLAIRSNLLLFRARWENVAFVSAERKDRWIVGPSGALLAQRWSYLDHTVLPVENLGALL
jgi:3-phenylpropionate/cinnamic acid dioxygenase small subunit